MMDRKRARQAGSSELISYLRERRSGGSAELLAFLRSIALQHTFARFVQSGYHTIGCIGAADLTKVGLTHDEQQVFLRAAESVRLARSPSRSGLSPASIGSKDYSDRSKTKAKPRRTAPVRAAVPQGSRGQRSPATLAARKSRPPVESAPAVGRSFVRSSSQQRRASPERSGPFFGSPGVSPIVPARKEHISPRGAALMMRDTLEAHSLAHETTEQAALAVARSYSRDSNSPRSPPRHYPGALSPQGPPETGRDAPQSLGLAQLQVALQQERQWREQAEKRAHEATEAHRTDWVQMQAEREAHKVARIESESHIARLEALQEPRYLQLQAELNVALRRLEVNARAEEDNLASVHSRARSQALEEVAHSMQTELERREMAEAGFRSALQELEQYKQALEAIKAGLGGSYPSTVTDPGEWLLSAAQAKGQPDQSLMVNELLMKQLQESSPGGRRRADGDSSDDDTGKGAFLSNTEPLPVRYTLCIYDASYREECACIIGNACGSLARRGGSGSTGHAGDSAAHSFP